MVLLPQIKASFQGLFRKKKIVFSNILVKAISMSIFGVKMRWIKVNIGLNHSGFNREFLLAEGYRFQF